MNCNNCGAPLELIEGRNHFRCGFCATLNFPQELAESADGVKPLGQPADESCPACATIMQHASIDGARVVFCDQCRGVLSDSETFSFIVQKKRATYRSPDVVPPPLDRAQFDRRLHCPKCERPMETHAYYGPGNAVIDSCAPCRVIWVDHHEIAAIEKAPGSR